MSRDWRELMRLRRLISRRLLLSRLSLSLERLTAALWELAVLVGFFVAVALFDILPNLPNVLHGLVLIGLLISLYLLVRRGFQDFAWPSALQAQHRLETGSGVNHRPLTAWEDNLGYKAGPGQNTLWMAHKLRMQSLIERLLPPLPAAVVSLRDPFALRSLVTLLCVIGTLGAWGDIGPRFIRAFNPALASDSGPVDVKVWLTPPAYTQQPPLLLDPTEEEVPTDVVEVPVGTQALVIVTGTSRLTRLVVDNTSFELVPMDDASLRYEGLLPEGNRLEVRQTGKVLGAWSLVSLPDARPSIVLSDPPDITGRYRLRIKYAADDDYGIVGVTGYIDLPEETRRYAQNWAEDFTLSLPPLSPKSIKHQSFHDFTAHPWAGETVTITLTAQDAAGQTGTSDPTQFRLPERPFVHPVATTIIRSRKDLIADPTTAPLAARALGRLMEVPESYGGDVVAHLAMASARSRLNLQDAVSVMDSVIDLMWRAALRMEDGAFAVAEQALNDAEEALNEAIERGASPQEISQLISRLQRTLMEYYQALLEKMPNGTFPFSDPNGDLQAIGSEDLAQMMEQLRQFSEMGADSAAKKMMSNLRNMLEMLRNTALDSMDHPDVEAARKMMEELKEITQEQSDLLNKTFEQARQHILERNQDGQSRRSRAERWRTEQQENRQSQPKQGQADREKQQEGATVDQNELRQRLGDLMERMAEMTGDVPGDLGKADQAMREAEGSLREGAWRPASDSQSEALANLQSGMQGAAQQLMQTLAEQGLMGLIPMPGLTGRPFGAMGPNLGPDQGEGVELPTEPDTRGLSQKSRAILEEIRRRAGQRLRPRNERQYLRRLLEQF